MHVEMMMSELEATGHLTLTMAQCGDMLDIAYRVTHGDESGWRGDPTMRLFVNPATDNFEVWGIDRGGNEYLACSHDKLDHTILIKLREGDPQKHDVIQRVLDHNAKVKADAAAADRDKFMVVGDKVRHAINREFNNGRGMFTALPKKVGSK